MQIDSGFLAWGLALSLAAAASPAAELESWNPREAAVHDLVNEQRAHQGLAALLADSRLHDAAAAHSLDMLSADFFSHTNLQGLDAAARIRAAGYDGSSSGENIAAGQGRTFSGQGIVELPPLEAARAVMFGTEDLDEFRQFVTDNGLGDAGQLTWAGVGVGWTAADWDAWQVARGNRGGWMGSSGHRGNVLRSGYTDLGVGYAFSADDAGAVDFDVYWTQKFASGDSAPPGPVMEPPADPIDVRRLFFLLPLLLEE